MILSNVKTGQFVRLTAGQNPYREAARRGWTDFETMPDEIETKDPARVANRVLASSPGTPARAILNDEMSRSLALDALFPGIFVGPHKVSSTVIGNLKFRPQHAIFRVYRADGRQSELPALSVPCELWGAKPFADYVQYLRRGFAPQHITLQQFVDAGFKQPQKGGKP